MMIKKKAKKYGHTCPALGNKGLVTAGCGEATVAAGAAARGIIAAVVEAGACGMWFKPGRWPIGGGIPVRSNTSKRSVTIFFFQPL